MPLKSPVLYDLGIGCVNVLRRVGESIQHLIPFASHRDGMGGTLLRHRYGTVGDPPDS